MCHTPTKQEKKDSTHTRPASMLSHVAEEKEDDKGKFQVQAVGGVGSSNSEEETVKKTDRDK